MGRSTGLSASWVDAATSIPESVSLKEGDFAYGYLWWLNPDYYKAAGRDGQKIYVIPEKDMVVVHTGAGGTKINAADFPLEDFHLEEPVLALTPLSEKELLIPYIIQAASPKLRCLPIPAAYLYWSPRFNKPQRRPKPRRCHLYRIRLERCPGRLIHWMPTRSVLRAYH